MYRRLFWGHIVNCADIYAGGKDPSWTVPARHPGPEIILKNKIIKH